MSSIRVRLLVIILSLMMASLGLQTGLSYYYSKQALTQSVDETARAIGVDYAKRVQASTNELVIQLQGVASTQRLRNASDNKQIIEALAEAQQRVDAFSVVNFIYPDGTTLRSDGTTANLGDREYFKQVVQTKQPVISDPLVVRSTGKLSVNIAVPVLDNGVLKGVATGTMGLDYINDMVKAIRFKDSGYGAIYEDGGMMLAHGKKPELIGKLSLKEKNINPELNIGATELDEKLMMLFESVVGTGEQERGTHVFLDNAAMVSVFTPIDLPGGQRWIVAITAPEAEITREVGKLTAIMLATALACIVLGALVVMFVSGRFARPIVRLRDEALLLAEGDLRARNTVVRSQDEIGQLALAFAQMSDRLRAVVVNVQSQAEAVAASSEQLTATADQSARAANQVAASITDVASASAEQLAAADETSAVVQQMSAGIQQIAANTNQVAVQSAQAADKAKAGDKAVERAVIQMGHIEETVDASARVVTILGERSKEIGQIVDTIAGIAGQTNLLALNAAIEAARAGEQGRGFAVVAEEVRKLAEQSQEAAKKIAELIGEIQGDTAKAVEAMNEGTREVKTGTEVVNAAGAAFREIAALVTRVSGQVKEISAAIQQMAAGSQQIVDSVKKIDKLSKTSAGEAQSVSAATEEQLASMEEIAHASEALSKLAQDLQVAVANFRV